MADQGYTEPLGDTWKYDADYNRAADFLGIDRHQRESIKVAQKVSYLVDWAHTQSKNTNIQDALLRLNKLRKDLGLNTQGELLLGQIFEYVRLKADIERKPTKAPFDEVMNNMIKQKLDEREIKNQTTFSDIQKQTNKQIGNDQKRAELVAQKAIIDHKKSFTPEVKIPVKVQGQVVSTPIPDRYVGRAIAHAEP